MAESPILNPAEKAAEAALERLYSCLDSKKSFRMEAGAGAGKTHSLVKALERLLETEAESMVRHGQRIACITYTNVASEEITSRTGRHSAVFSATIHTFCWSLISDFQHAVRKELPAINKWAQRIEEKGPLLAMPIEYDLGYPAIRDGRVLLGHDDIVPLTVRLLESGKFRQILTSRFPIIFIDEYQDTLKEFVEAIKMHFLDTGSGPLIGLFGDRWQKIYGQGCGPIEHKALDVIEKGANFRSAPAIVNLLNAIRPELPQEVRDPEAEGHVAFFHANEWTGARRDDGHSRGDLSAEAIFKHIETMKAHLEAEGWDFAGTSTKVLMLTHRALAAQQGYAGIVEAFGRNESWSNKEDPIIKFFADSFEPAHKAYTDRRFGLMFEALGRRAPTIRRASDKAKWDESFAALSNIRLAGTIGEALQHMSETGKPRLPESVQNRWDEYVRVKEAEPTEDDSSGVAILRKLAPLPYAEIVALSHFLEESTPFQTQHGVKGAEFDNVIVICGRGWNLYDFVKMLEWWPEPPRGKEQAYERARNLFYVACSRPKNRLAVLFTQELSPKAEATIEKWIGTGAVRGLAVEE